MVEQTGCGVHHDRGTTYLRNRSARLFQLFSVPLREVDVGGGGALRRRDAVLVHFRLLRLLIARLVLVAVALMRLVAAVVVAVVLLRRRLGLRLRVVGDRLRLHVVVHHLLAGVHLAELVLLAGVRQTGAHHGQVKAGCGQHRDLCHGRMQLVVVGEGGRVLRHGVVIVGVL